MEVEKKKRVKVSLPLNIPPVCGPNKSKTMTLQLKLTLDRISSSSTQ